MPSTGDPPPSVPLCHTSPPASSSSSGTPLMYSTLLHLRQAQGIRKGVEMSGSKRKSSALC